MKRLLKKTSSLIFGMLLVSIAWNSGDILLRRWWWQQVPSQVNAVTVYGLLACNAVILIGLCQSFRHRKGRLRWPR